MWVTTHQGNQPWVLGSTWGLKWHFHSHLSWMILAVSDRNYCFVSSRILSLHLAFSINGKTFYFFKDKPLDVTFLNFLPLNIHSCLCLVCHFLSPFPKKKKKKKASLLSIWIRSPNLWSRLHPLNFFQGDPFLDYVFFNLPLLMPSFLSAIKHESNKKIVY